MSSISRSRTLRKPSTDSSTINSDQRHVSPSRLPVNRSASTATNRSTSSATTTGTRSASTATRSTSIATRSSTAKDSKANSTLSGSNALKTARTVPKTASTRQPESGLSRTVSTRQPDPSKKESSRYPPSTTVTRSATTATRPARPTSSGAATTQPTRRATGHTRAKSTTTTSATVSAVLRPPLTSSTGSRPLHARKPSIDPKPSVAGKPSPPVPRKPSPDRKTPPVTRKPSPDRKTPIERKSSPTRKPQTPPKLAPAAARLRPAFNTLQQHYTPAKTLAPKPLTATFLAPPSPSKLPANIAASAETSKLQAELLTLHLLHRDAGVVDAQWQASAKEKLGQRFEELVEQSNEVADRERSALERENVLALRAWDGGLEGKIQALDGIIHGLWGLGEAGGKYARMIRRFERWTDQFSEIQDARRTGDFLPQNNQGLFISELDTSWKDDSANIVRRLDGWRRQLREIGEPATSDEGTQDSSLGRMLGGSRMMVHDMLAEIGIMEEIEREALEAEDAWIEKMSREDDDDTPRAGAIWRVF